MDDYTMNSQQALTLLRNNPQQAFQQCAFLIKPYSALQYGGTCSVDIAPLEKARSENMFTLTLKADVNATDYFYPFATGIDIGECEVPKACPAGTLVFTSGMNGCSLQVNDLAINNSLLFMHCRNAAPGHLGNVLCRVDYKHYAGPSGNPNAVSKQEPGSSGISYLALTNNIPHINYAYYPITVKTGGSNWQVYINGIVNDVDMNYTKIPGTNMRDVYHTCSFDA